MDTERNVLPDNDRDPLADKLLDRILDDVSELALLGKLLAKNEVGVALKPVKRVLASAVIAAVFGFAGLLDLIHLSVAYAIGGEVGVSRAWLGWSAFVLLALASAIGYFGTRRRAAHRPQALVRGQQTALPV